MMNNGSLFCMLTPQMLQELCCRRREWQRPDSDDVYPFEEADIFQDT